MDILHAEEENFTDMDLVDILWMQDMDMGVTKETFHCNIRKELEKEDPELLKIKEEEIPSQTSLLDADCLQDAVGNDESVTFVVDVETGELVPVAKEADTQPMEVEQTTPNTNALQISFEDALSILEAESKVPLSPLQSMQTDEKKLQTEIESLVENMSGLVYSSQSSMEARWQDVEGFISSDITDPSNTPVIKVDVSNTAGGVKAATANQINTLLHNTDSFKPEESQNITFQISKPDGNVVSGSANGSQMVNKVGESEEMLLAVFPDTAVGTPRTTSFLQDLLDNITTTDVVKLEGNDSGVGSLSSDSSEQDFGDGLSDPVSPFEGFGKANADFSFTENVPQFDANKTEHNFSTIEWNAVDFQSAETGDSNDSSDSSFSQQHQQQTSKQEKSQKQKEIDRKIARSRDERKAKAMKIPFTVEEIVHSQVEKFNEMITNYKLTDGQLQLIKDIRRRGKNKVAAQNCRKRKMEVIETLEESVIRMRREKQQFIQQREALKSEKNHLFDKYNGLYRDVFRSLRDENGRQYDPNEYTLQHTADGNVFLVPKTSGPANIDPELKDLRKRKGRKK